MEIRLKDLSNPKTSLHDFDLKTLELLTIVQSANPNDFIQKPIQIGDKIYRWCWYNQINDTLVVEEIDPQDELECFYEDEPKCPFCGLKVADAFEFADESTHKCDCGATFEISRVIEVSYNSTLKSRPNIIFLD